MEFRTLTKRVADKMKVEAPAIPDAPAAPVTEDAAQEAAAPEQPAFDHASYECVRDRAALDPLDLRLRPGPCRGRYRDHQP